MNMEKEIEIDGYRFTYLLKIKKIKNLILKVEPDGSLVVSANAYIPQAKIDAFLTERIRWILKKQTSQKKQYEIMFQDCLQQSTFYYFGVPHPILCVQSNQHQVSIKDGTMYVYYKHEKSECNKTIQTFIQHICKQQITQMVIDYVQLLKDYKLPMPVVKYRKMKSRWGSCATQKNTITLNMKLVHYPKAFIEYVILHELVHFIQPNHSRHFYQIVEYYMPDYKTRIQYSQTFVNDL